jgi:hypothetical protein
MKDFESFDHANEHLPDEVLRHRRIALLVIDYLLVQIPIVSEVHDQTEGRGGILKEGLLVSHDVRVTKTAEQHDPISSYLLNGGKDSDLIESILLLLL